MNPLIIAVVLSQPVAPFAAVAAIAITSPVLPALSGGSTLQLLAIVYPASANPAVTWAADTGTVSASGLYTAPAPSSVIRFANVIATAGNGVTSFLSLAILPTIIEGITVPNAPFALDGATSVTLTPIVSGQNLPTTATTITSDIGSLSGNVLTAPAATSVMQVINVTVSSVYNPAKQTGFQVIVPATNAAEKASDLNAMYLIQKAIRQTRRW